jgi:hypothetical protein
VHTTEPTDDADDLDDEEIPSEWRMELRLRCSSLDADIVELRDADDVFADAFAALQLESPVVAP